MKLPHLIACFLFLAVSSPAIAQDKTQNTARLCFIERDTAKSESQFQLKVYDPKTKSSADILDGSKHWIKVFALSPNKDYLLVHRRSEDSESARLLIIACKTLKVIHSHTVSTDSSALFLNNQTLLLIEATNNAAQNTRGHTITRMNLDGKNNEVLHKSEQPYWNDVQPIISADKTKLYYFSRAEEALISFDLKTREIDKPFPDSTTLVTFTPNAKSCAIFVKDKLCGQIGAIKNGEFKSSKEFERLNLIVRFLGNQHLIKAKIGPNRRTEAFVEKLDGSNAQKISSNFDLSMLQRGGVTYNSTTGHLAWVERDSKTGKSKVVLTKLSQGKVGKPITVTEGTQQNFGLFFFP